MAKPDLMTATTSLLLSSAPPWLLPRALVSRGTQLAGPRLPPRPLCPTLGPPNTAPLCALVLGVHEVSTLSQDNLQQPWLNQVSLSDSQ